METKLTQTTSAVIIFSVLGQEFVNFYQELILDYFENIYSQHSECPHKNAHIFWANLACL